MPRNPSHPVFPWRILASLALSLATVHAGARDLDEVAGWVLDAPPLLVGKPLPTTAWKPGRPVTPAVLAQMEAQVAAADRLPLKALWWEHQGQLGKIETLGSTSTAPADDGTQGEWVAH